MNLPIPQKAVLKPIIASSGSGIMALWLFDKKLYGYAWPTGRLNRLFIGPKMFAMSSGLYQEEAHGISNFTTDTYTLTGHYINEATHFCVEFTILNKETSCTVEVMSADVGSNGSTATFELEELSMAELFDIPPLIPVHRVFMDEMKDHIYVTSEKELQAILSDEPLRASYEGVAFYAISAGRED